MVNLPDCKNNDYWNAVQRWAIEYGSDGCTCVKDYYIEACWEHDFHHRYGVTLYGDPITFSETNERFRKVIQMRSKLGRFSPLSWVRWLGVEEPIGKYLWDRHRQDGEKSPVLLQR